MNWIENKCDLIVNGLKEHFNQYKKTFIVVKWIAGILIISLVVFELYEIEQYCYANGWCYYFFDVLVKAFSGMGAILAGVFVYVKWRDEKTRKLYAKSLYKVYTPLISVIIRQEEYRRTICPDIEQSAVPILSITITTIRQHLTFSSGVQFSQSKEERDGLLSNKFFFRAINSDQEAYGLMSPTLLSYIRSYGLLVSLEEEKIKKLLNDYPAFQSDEKMYGQAIATEQGKELLKIAGRRVEIESKLILEIIEGYNKCVDKLGMYKDKIKLLSK
jgi:hypothetical protein